MVTPERMDPDTPRRRYAIFTGNREQRNSAHIGVKRVTKETKRKFILYAECM